MKINTIIDRYVFRELFAPFGICLVFLTFVFLMTQILEVTSMVVNYGVDLSSVLKLLTYSMPKFLTYTIPMSCMLAVLLTFIRMSADNEVTAVKAGGASVYRFLPPVLLFCVIAGLMTAVMTVFLAPKGKLAIQTLGKEVAASNIEVGLKARTFNGSFDGVMLYVNEIDMDDGRLKDIFLEDSRDPRIVSSIVAPKGELLSGENRYAYVLRLYGGGVNQVDLEGGSVNATRFTTYDIHLDLRQVAGKKVVRKHRDEMSIPELLAYIKDPEQGVEQVNSARMELHEKFSIPFACLALGLLAVPVGMQSASSRQRGSGVGIGLFFFLFYYLLLAAGWSIGESAKYPPGLGMWMPDMVMGGIGFYLLRRTAKEEPIALARILPAAFGRIKNLISRQREETAAQE